MRIFWTYKTHVSFLLILSLLTVGTAHCATVRGKSPGKNGAGEAENMRELWYVVKIMDSPVGLARETRRTVGGATSTTEYMNLTMSRMGQEINMVMSVEIHDGPDGRLRSAKTSMTASVMSMVSSATMDGDTIRYTSRSAGFEHNKSIPWEAGAIGPATADAYAVKALRNGEEVVSYRTFEVESGEFKTVRLKRINGEPLEIDGRVQTPVVVEEYEENDETPMSTTWLDENFEPFKTTISEMGLDISVERIAPEQIDSLEFEPDFDIIKQSMIMCEGYPDGVGRIRDVTMRMQFEQMPAEGRDFNGPGQSVVNKGENYVDLLVSRETINRISMTGPETKAKLFLDADRYIQSDHPKIRAVADSIRTSTGESGWALARKITEWVSGHINQKDFTKGFASALEVLETRSGDCTEHSMLLTALLRAAGIPARPAVGLAYAEGRLVGHMWAEAHVDYWRTLDALDLDTRPIRIRISAAGDDRAIDEKELVRAYRVVSGLGVKVIDHTLEESR